MCFHAYKSVAPLKHCPWFSAQLPAACFHAYKSVAPLKPVIERGEWDGDAAFPRLQKRGPIEARRAGGGPANCPPCFHAYKSVAPLKRECGRAGGG